MSKDYSRIGRAAWVNLSAEERSTQQRRRYVVGMPKRVADVANEFDDEHVIEIFRILAPRLREVGEIDD